MTSYQPGKMMIPDPADARDIGVPVGDVVVGFAPRRAPEGANERGIMSALLALSSDITPWAPTDGYKLAPDVKRAVVAKHTPDMLEEWGDFLVANAFTCTEIWLDAAAQQPLALVWSFDLGEGVRKSLKLLEKIKENVAKDGYIAFEVANAQDGQFVRQFRLLAGREFRFVHDSVAGDVFSCRLVKRPEDGAAGIAYPAPLMAFAAEATKARSRVETITLFRSKR